MFNIVYSEFLKLKKSYIMVVALIATLFIPMIMFIDMIINFQSDAKNSFQIENYIVNFNLNQIQFIYTLIFSLISGYIFSREFTDKTANVIYSYPLNRMKIFFGKLITIYILILVLYAINFLFISLIMYLQFGQQYFREIFISQIKVNILSSILQFLIINIPILIANISKNIIFPVIYGVLVAVSSMFIMLSGIYMQFNPLMIPALPIYYIYMKDPIDFVLVSIVGLLTFTISICLCLYHYNNIDIT